VSSDANSFLRWAFVDLHFPPWEFILFHTPAEGIKLLERGSLAVFSFVQRKIAVRFLG